MSNISQDPELMEVTRRLNALSPKLRKIAVREILHAFTELGTEDPAFVDAVLSSLPKEVSGC